MRPRGQWQIFTVRDHDDWERNRLSGQRGDPSGGHDEALRAAVSDDPLDLRELGIGIQDDGYTSGAEDSRERDHQLETAGEQQHHAIARCETELCQRSGQPTAVVMQCSACPRATADDKRVVVAVGLEILVLQARDIHGSRTDLPLKMTGELA